MTICAAAISRYSYKDCIIVVFDRKASMAEFTAEGMVWKLQTIHPHWRAMFAGDNSSMVALLDAIKTDVANLAGNEMRSFGRACSRSYRAERERIIETEVLAEHDIHSYAEYVALKTSDRDFYEKLTQKIKSAEEKWNILVFGYDKYRKPHIFVITEYGKLQWCDAEGVAAIGSGSWIFWNALAQQGFNRFGPKGEAVWAILSSKFAAEKADGVGEETVLVVVEPTDRIGRSIRGLDPKEVKEMRERWRSLPKIPEGIAVELEEKIGSSTNKGYYKVPNPLKGYLKRSKFRRSKQGR